MPGMDMPGMDMSQHQDMQGMKMGSPMSQSPQNGSITHDTMNLQEPENPAHKTGSNLPAPNLLKDVTTRQPMALADFLSLADKNNPTIAQANAALAAWPPPLKINKPMVRTWVKIRQDQLS